MPTQTATVPVKAMVDRETKAQASALYAKLGLNLSSAINMFLHQSILDGGLPFTPRDPFYSASNMDALRIALEEEKSGKVAARATADEFDDLIESL